MYFLSPGGTGNSASSGFWGMTSSGWSGSCKAGIALQVGQLRPDHDIVGVLFQPFLKALYVVQILRVGPVLPSSSSRFLRTHGDVGVGAAGAVATGGDAALPLTQRARLVLVPPWAGQGIRR